ncbi:MAG: hypothetical protein ACLFPV_00980 [Spirochaetaceae bacterium]
MIAYYLGIGLTYAVIGFGAALLFYFGLKKQYLGKFWGALIVGLIGAFAGGVFALVFEDLIERLANLNDSVNIFPPIIVSTLFLVFFGSIGSQGRK